MTLVPKIPSASKVEDFRLIVLGNFLFKILTKIIATRVGLVLNKMLSPSQYGFTPGKKIHHCIAAASEGVNCLNKDGGNMAMKIDIHKAFDTMHWEFPFLVEGPRPFICSLLRIESWENLINGQVLYSQWQGEFVW